MESSQFRLLASRRLAPLFVTQFLGAMNDNLFKSALVMLVEFRATMDVATIHAIVTLAPALLILPYFLGSATAGQLADKYEKTRLLRLIKLWEVGVMVLAAIGFVLDNTAYQLTVLFLLGVQATFFGPVKYGILPDLLSIDELMSGNALVEAGTFLAILIGTIAGGLLILVDHGPAIVAVLQLVLAAGGWAVSFAIPVGKRAAPDLHIDRNFLAATWRTMREATQGRDIGLSILGISWFWLVGATFLAQFPNFAKDILRADNQVVTLFLTLFSIGIGAGSLLVGRLLRGEISARLVPYGALGMALFSLDLYFASGSVVTSDAALVNAVGFLAHPANWRLIGDLLAIAITGGLFVVPLYAILQTRSDAGHRSQMIAANNILNALFMVASGAIAALALKFGASVPSIFLSIAIANGVLAAGTMRLGFAPKKAQRMNSK